MIESFTKKGLKNCKINFSGFKFQSFPYFKDTDNIFYRRSFQDAMEGKNCHYSYSFFQGLVGIYIILNSNFKVIYVGMSKNDVGNRIRCHEKKGWDIKYIFFSDDYSEENEILGIERKMIKKFQPKFNIDFK